MTLTAAGAAIIVGTAIEEAAEDDLDAEVYTMRLFVLCTREGVVEVDENARLVLVCHPCTFFSPLQAR